MKILLGLTGSVASTLHDKLLHSLSTLGKVTTIVTNSAKPFISKEFVQGKDVYTDEDEWMWQGKNGFDVKRYWAKGDRVLHIELRDAADVLVIAPCSANTLAKLANGLCDNLLTSVARAWDFKKRLVIAPAMNTYMWEHPITQEHLAKLKEWGALIVKPQSKMLACKTEGMGAMADISDIVKAIQFKKRWLFPLDHGRYTIRGIPVKGHPGSYLHKRKHHTHTGVDLYTYDKAVVRAVEDGVIVSLEPFTGAIDGSPWWEDTWCVLVEGASGVVCYGELYQDLGCRKVGDKVYRGMGIGNVKKVLKQDYPEPNVEGHSPSMLHIEMYKPGIKRAFEEQGKNLSDWNDLVDPTPYLINAKGAPERLWK